MLKMNHWVLTVPEGADSIGYVGEHLANRIEIALDRSYEGWAWKLDVLPPSGTPAVLSLNRDGDTLYCEMDRTLLTQSGPVRCTLRGLFGVVVRKTNTVNLTIYGAVNAVNALKPLPPSEFEQMEARVSDLKEQTEQAAVVAASTPYIAPENQHWMVYHRDAGAYVDSGVKAQGEPGRDGADGLDGDTPYIKFGTWWVGDRDTGVPASGEVENAQPLTNQELEELLGGL